MLNPLDATLTKNQGGGQEAIPIRIFILTSITTKDPYHSTSRLFGIRHGGEVKALFRSSRDTDHGTRSSEQVMVEDFEVRQ